MAETPVSFVNAMEGVALAEKKRFDLAIATAWHTAIFALNGYGGKLKPLSKYLNNSEAPEAPALQHAKAIAWAHTMKAKGFPVKIERVTRH